MLSLTNAPLPTFRNLVSAFLNHKRSDIELFTPWRRSRDIAFVLSRSAWSFYAIAQLRMRVEGTGTITVWVPDFFCNASLEPLRSIGVHLLFYPLTKQMTPDFDICHIMANETTPDLFILVHYFGQPSLAENAALFCRKKKAWLIEDAAHVLRPIKGIGEYGDFVLYSPHKHLPIPDGALLLVRRNGPAKLALQDKTIEIFQEIYSSLINTPGFSSKPAYVWLIKRIFQRLGIRHLRRKITPFTQDIDTTYSSLTHPKLSSMTCLLLPFLLNSLDNVAHKRCQNRLMWEKLLPKYEETELTKWTTINKFTPYLSGFIFKSPIVAEKVFLKWQRIGLSVTTWPDLPPEVINDPTLHSLAVKLQQTQLYIPVHQTISKRKLRKKIQKLAK